MQKFTVRRRAAQTALDQQSKVLKQLEKVDPDTRTALLQDAYSNQDGDRERAAALTLRVKALEQRSLGRGIHKKKTDSGESDPS